MRKLSQKTNIVVNDGLVTITVKDFLNFNGSRTDVNDYSSLDEFTLKPQNEPSSLRSYHDLIEDLNYDSPKRSPKNKSHESSSFVDAWEARYARLPEANKLNPPLLLKGRHVPSKKGPKCAINRQNVTFKAFQGDIEKGERSIGFKSAPK